MQDQPPPVPASVPATSKPKVRSWVSPISVKKPWQEEFPIHYNANIGDIDSLRNAMGLNSAEPKDCIRSKCNSLDDDGWTPLHYASWYNQLAAVRVLIQEGQADVNAVVPSNKSSVLHFAAGCGHPKVVQFLLSSGARKDAMDAERKTPLSLCKELKQNQWASVVPLLE